MARLRYNRKRAAAHLADQCPVMAGFIARFGPLRLPVRDGEVFPALARAIAYQQLSGKAAGTIHGRFEALFENGRPDAHACLDIRHDALRATGLSEAKARSIRDLAERVASGSLPSRHRLGRMDDEAVVDALTAVRGIGPWTAQMYLIFNLGRPDVMPATDLGVQRGVQMLYGLDGFPEPAEVERRTLRFAPYRSAAAWYLWRASETVLPA